MMSGNIWRYDQYDLRKYSPGSIDYFLDIGGCVGTTGVFFKSIDPFAQVISIEPCKEDFATMCQVAGFWGVKCYQLALGNGEPMCFEYRRQGGHRLYTEAEKQWWPEGSYMVESKTLTELYKHFKLRGRYIIKVDTEGGERALLEDAGAIDIIRGAVQFNMEYHRGFGGEQERWHEWFQNFKNTHVLYYRTKEKDGYKCIFEESIGPNKNWRSEYMLVKK